MNEKLINTKCTFQNKFKQESKLRKKLKKNCLLGLKLEINSTYCLVQQFVTHYLTYR